jgi:predicted NAD/FAD-dependent oxidoreductase
MNAIAKHLAEKLTVNFNERVVKISCNATWEVETDIGKKYNADAVLLTMPVPQSLELLSASNILLPKKIEEKLQAIAYHPCIALMAVFEGDSPVLHSGGMWLQGEPVAWMSDNFQKGITSVPTMTIHAGPKFSAEHWTDSDAMIESAMMSAVNPWISAKPIMTQTHRWRYSFAKSLHNEPCIIAQLPAVLAFAGDAFVAPRVEGAALSGLAAADALLKTMQT